MIALETGLRRGDLLSLKWSSIQNDWLRVVMQKTKREAVLPLSQACRKALAECRSRPLVGESVFLTAEGRPYSVATIRRYFAKAKVIAGITRRFRFHDMRHTFASRLASAGVPIQVIARALGHMSSRTAEKYARPSEAALESILSALDSTGKTQQTRS